MKLLSNLILIGSLTCLSTAYAGNEGGGGHRVENQFFEIAQVAMRGIQKEINEGNSKLFEGFDVNSFEAAVVSNEVYAVANLCVTYQDHNNGQIFHRCEDGRYFPDEKKILVSISEWEKKSCVEKVSLVVHEFGRASANEGGNYKYSSKVAFSKKIKNECTIYNGRQEQ